jgi:hypothetical protein
MKFLIFSFLVFLSLQSCAFDAPMDNLEAENSGEDSLFFANRLALKIDETHQYLKNNTSFNQQYVVLIDMKVNSGKNRLFVLDLSTDRIVSKGLVAHGSGSNTYVRDSLIFSNVPNSYKTSLGKYKIGASYPGRFGKSYKLHGLDASNSNAFDRFIVLHRYSCVPNEEQSYEICNSLGCPMVSEAYFEELDTYIEPSEKPLLLEIFY